ncbi:MAG: histidine phosphatase family protein [Acidobacteriota bacterium]
MQVWLVRHADTLWTGTRQHTGWTDLPLTDEGRRRGALLRDVLSGHPFEKVLSSPLQRAAETAQLAGLGEKTVIDPDLREWNYGDLDGKTRMEIQREIPGWDIWTHGARNGETIEQVAARADAVIARIASLDGDVALFSHGHFLQLLAARWMQLQAIDGRRLKLDTASVSVLGYSNDARALLKWNQTVTEAK